MCWDGSLKATAYNAHTSQMHDGEQGAQAGNAPDHSLG